MADLGCKVKSHQPHVAATTGAASLLEAVFCWLKCETVTAFATRRGLDALEKSKLWHGDAESCGNVFGVRSTPVLPQWHVKKKKTGHSAKSAGGRLHLNTHTPLTQRSRSGLTMPLSMHSVGTYQESSSYATREGTLGYSLLSSLTHRGVILA